jgi:hypothetical protein
VAVGSACGSDDDAASPIGVSPTTSVGTSPAISVETGPSTSVTTQPSGSSPDAGIELIGFDPEREAVFLDAVRGLGEASTIVRATLGPLPEIVRSAMPEYQASSPFLSIVVRPEADPHEADMAAWQGNLVLAHAIHEAAAKGVPIEGGTVDAEGASPISAANLMLVPTADLPLLYHPEGESEGATAHDEVAARRYILDRARALGARVRGLEFRDVHALAPVLDVELDDPDVVLRSDDGFGLLFGQGYGQWDGVFLIVRDAEGTVIANADFAFGQYAGTRRGYPSDEGPTTVPD